jgi:hypothetical protein
MRAEERQMVAVVCGWWVVVVVKVSGRRGGSGRQWAGDARLAEAVAWAVTRRARAAQGSAGGGWRRQRRVRSRGHDSN